MRHTITLSAIALTTATLALIPVSSLTGQEQPDPDTIRIGIYDNRAIAIAYVASDHHNQQLKPIIKQHQQAVDKDDTRTIEAIETRMRLHQQALHFQGFGHVPVTEMLEPVHDDLEKLADELGLAAITFDCDVTADNVVRIDITDRIVQLYNPSDRTLKMTQSIKKAEPLSLTKLIGMDHNH